MSLSNKKLKYIHRFAGKQSPQEMAKKLRLPVAKVQLEIEKLSGSKVRPKPKKSAYFTSFYILAILVFLVPFPNFGEIYASSYLPKAALIQIGSLLLLTVWLFEQFRANTLTIVKCRLYLPLAAFLLWVLLSITWSLNTYSVLSKWTHWAACGLIFFLAAQIIKNRQQARFIFIMIVSSAVVLSFLGFFQYLLRVDWFPQTARPAITFANKNMAAHFFVLVFPAGLYLLLSAKNKRAIWLYAFFLACLNTYVFYTHTKAAWVCVTFEFLLFISVFVFEKIRFKTKTDFGKHKAAAFGVAIALTIAMSFLTPDGLRWRGPETYNYIAGMWDAEARVADEKLQKLRKYSSISVESRLILYQNTLELFAKKPLLGVGAGNFSIHYPTASIKRPRDNKSLILKQAVHGHNDFLQLLSELGLPFAIIFIWACVLFIQGIGKLGRKACPPEDRQMGAAALIALAGIALNANFSFPFYRAVAPFLLAVYSAIFFTAYRGFAVKNQNRGDTWSVAGTQWSKVCFILSLAGLILWSMAQYRVIKSDEHYHSMHVAIRLEKYEEALAQIELAKHYNPLPKETMKMKGQIYLKLGKVKKARDLLTAYQKYNPYYAQGLMLLGRSHQLLKEYQEAEKALQRGIEIDPHVERMHDLLASVKSSLGKHEEALKEFRRAAELKPDNFNYQYNLGIKAREMKRFEEAAGAFRKTIDLKPTFDKGHLLLGLILFYELDEQDSGIIHLNIALRLNPRIKDAGQLRQIIAAHESSSES